MRSAAARGFLAHAALAFTRVAAGSRNCLVWCLFFFFQAEDGIRDDLVTGVQTCALPIYAPEINWDYAAIQRLNPVDLSTTLIPFSLGKAVLEGDETNNPELRAGDIVTIFSQRDISVPIKRQTMLVRVEGEVRVPGIYKIQQGDSLREILERAGGLTENAYLYGTQ